MYNFAKSIFYIIFCCLCRWKVTGKQNLPEEGPVVVVCNHVSNWDPVAVGVALRRQVFFMAKEELFKIPVFGRCLRIVGSFPVKRGQNDRAAIKRAMEVLREGNVLGVFPEGHRSKSGELEEFSEGAVHLAVKFNAPILPVGVKGTSKVFYKGWFRSFSVNIGQPVFPENTEGLETTEFVKVLNRRIREEVGKLSGQELK